MTGTHDIQSASINCICATNPRCKSPVAIYEIDRGMEVNFEFRVVYIVPGWIAGCSPIDSLLLSTLECFYSNSTCFPILMGYIQEAYIQNVEYPSWFDVHPLVHDPKLSQYPPNTSISKIVQNIMIEKWNPSILYEQFYESCAPSNCTYSQRIHINTGVGVVLTLVSMIGGLTVSLRLITPQLVKLIARLLLAITAKKQQRQQPEGNC